MAALIDKPSPENKNFSYYTTKDAFEKMQMNYIKRNSAALVKGTLQLWSREKVDAYIEALLDYSYEDANELEPDSIVEDLARFEVSKVENNYKLVLKSKKYRGKPVEVVPWEECFDVILSIHRYIGHRGASCMKIYRHVSRQYVIDKIWIKFVMRACNMCKSGANHNTPRPSETRQCLMSYLVLFASIEPLSADGPFKYILIVIDKSTNFLHIRPLTNTATQTIALELLKIFTDFGVPKMIEAKEVYFCEEVSMIMRDFDTEMKVPVLRIHASAVIPPWVDLVKTRLMEWCEVNGSDNWCLGCQIVQWQMNNTICHYSTPYVELFHKEPSKDILG